MAIGALPSPAPGGYRLTCTHIQTFIRGEGEGRGGEERPVLGCIITDVHTTDNLCAEVCQIFSIFSCMKRRGGKHSCR